MTAYLTVTMTVHDASWRADYRARVPAILARYQGEYLAATTAAEVMEGDVPVPDMAVILKFPDMDLLKGFLSSEAYRPFKEARQAGSHSVMLGIDAS